MKHALNHLFVIAASAALFFMPASASALPEQKPQVMILGTFHFTGGSTDKVSETMGDMLSAKRQAEITAVIEKLATYAPTKIMLEATHDRNETLNKRYRDYLAGEYTLGANEIDQLGLRLAAMLEHEQVYAVDHMQPMDFGRMMQAGQAAGQEDILAWFQGKTASIQQELAAAQGPDKTLMDALRFHNGPWALAGNSLYLQLAELGTTEDPAGAEVIGSWYERNLKIYATIARHTEPGDRVLVIYGSGHLAQLAAFFEQNPRYESVSALEVLGNP